MNEIQPVRYRILLEPDMPNFRFSGTTEILFHADQPQAFLARVRAFLS